MHIEPYQGGYRMVPSTGATSPVRRALDDAAQSAAQCDSCETPLKPSAVDRVELSSLEFNTAEPGGASVDDALQRIREQLVAGVVNRPVDLEWPGGGNTVLNRAYFLSERSAAEFNASAVGRAIDVTG